jgi:hypothetical protein
MLIRDSKQFQFLNERNECKRGGFVCRIEEVPPLGRIAKKRRITKGKMAFQCYYPRHQGRCLMKPTLKIHIRVFLGNIMLLFYTLMITPCFSWVSTYTDLNMLIKKLNFMLVGLHEFLWWSSSS